MTANLLSRLQGLTAPDREVDARVHALAIGGRVHFIDDGDAVIERPIDGMWIRGIYPLKGKTIPRYTASLDAAIALCERVLPGWAWRVATCHVSDDAWVIPDFNHPIHGERLMREFGQVEGDPTAYWQEITDVDLRPSGRPAIALLIAILTALEARENG